MNKIQKYIYEESRVITTESSSRYVDAVVVKSDEGDLCLYKDHLQVMKQVQLDLLEKVSRFLNPEIYAEDMHYFIVKLKQEIGES